MLERLALEVALEIDDVGIARMRFDLGEVIERLLRMMEPQFEHANARFRFGSERLESDLGHEFLLGSHEPGPARELAVGHIQGMWRDLGREVRTRTVGLRRIEIAEGHFSTPAHEHGADEEICFVLGGEGLLWQDGVTCMVGDGDCIVHRPKRGIHVPSVYKL